MTEIVLEGPQGTFKSEVFRRLGYPWVTDDIGGNPLGSKDAAIQTAGVWVFELAELDEHTLGRDVAKTKSFMSRSTDKFRPPYGTHSLPQPRQCCFGCTTNKSEYLPDETGNRRWWPLACNGISLDLLETDREHLFGEAVSLYQQGQAWWLETIALNTIAAAEQDARYVPDSWDAPISQYLDHPTSPRRDGDGSLVLAPMRALDSVTVPEILKNVLRLDIGDWSHQHENRVAKSLRKVGWCRKQKTGQGRPRMAILAPKRRIMHQLSGEWCTQLVHKTPGSSYTYIHMHQCTSVRAGTCV